MKGSSNGFAPYFILFSILYHTVLCALNIDWNHFSRGNWHQRQICLCYVLDMRRDNNEGGGGNVSKIPKNVESIKNELAWYFRDKGN